MKHTILPILVATISSTAGASVLYTNAGPIAVDETGPGTNLPGMTVSRTNTDSDTLYFRFEVSSLLSNSTNENYFAAFNLYEGTSEHVGFGNAWSPHAYSAFNTAGGNVDLNSSTPEPSQSWQLVRGTDNTTMVVRIDYVSGGDDNITAWLNPDLSLPEAAQSPSLVTTFIGNATFDEIHLREGGGGGGWTFSDMAIATTGTDTGFFAVPEPGSGILAAGALAGLLLRRRRRA